jgi:hypothetical protein
MWTCRSNRYIGVLHKENERVINMPNIPGADISVDITTLIKCDEYPYYLTVLVDHFTCSIRTSLSAGMPTSAILFQLVFDTEIATHGKIIAV